jgi:eukaryotic-like serine/threonine-protein kinase
MTVTFTIIDGTRKGKSYSFNSRNVCWVGRHDDCTIHFAKHPNHEQISRFHCLIDIDPPRVTVRDFNSRHGTHVDGTLIGKRPRKQAAPQGIHTDIKPVEKNLYSGSIIGIGNIQIQVNISGEQPNYTSSPVFQPPKTMRLVADKAVGWLKDWLEIPKKTPVGQQEKELIGGYKIVRQIGEGGYGQVFLAENTQGRQVAIKIMLAAVAATPDKVKKFQREIDNAKVLKHANVVKLIDNGFDPSSNCLYYVMEYCTGDNLSAFMKKTGGIIPLILAKQIIFEILDGLEYTHNAEIPYVQLRDGDFDRGVGLVHRDIKPTNIMINSSLFGIAKIGDFGLSKAFDLAGLSGHTVAGDGSFRGTPEFMCRKQILEFIDAKPEVDIWSVAACLYYMLTNKNPRHLQKGEGWEVLLERDTLPIRDSNPDVPIALAEVIDRALQEGTRHSIILYYQRVSDFKADLSKAFQDISI